MFGWLFVVILLIAEIILLSMLLLPLPLFLSNSVVTMLNKLQKPIWFILFILTVLLANSWFDMNKAEGTFKDELNTVDNVGKEILLLNKKWRAERNFYLTAYTWTILVVLLRCHALISSTIKLQSDLTELETHYAMREKEEKKVEGETKKNK